eukprot:856172-Pelagomonas_calceolata.AAC.5
MTPLSCDHVTSAVLLKWKILHEVKTTTSLDPGGRVAPSSTFGGTLASLLHISPKPSLSMCAWQEHSHKPLTCHPGRRRAFSYGLPCIESLVPIDSLGLPPLYLLGTRLYLLTRCPGRSAQLRPDRAPALPARCTKQGCDASKTRMIIRQKAHTYHGACKLHKAKLQHSQKNG